MPRIRQSTPGVHLLLSLQRPIRAKECRGSDRAHGWARVRLGEAAPLARDARCGLNTTGAATGWRHPPTVTARDARCGLNSTGAAAGWRRPLPSSGWGGDADPARDAALQPRFRRREARSRAGRQRVDAAGLRSLGLHTARTIPPHAAQRPSASGPCSLGLYVAAT